MLTGPLKELTPPPVMVSATPRAHQKPLSAYLSAVVLTLTLSLLSALPALTSQAHAEVPAGDVIDLRATLTFEGAMLLSPLSADEASSPSAEGRVVLLLPLELELERLTGLKLGELKAQGLLVREGGAQPMLNDLHAYSNLRAEDRAQLFELWWSRGWALRGGELSARLGKLDANDHFAVSEHESRLINGAAGYSPSIFGMPSYPDAAWSAQLEYETTRWALSLGVFDGGATSVRPTPTGARLWLSPNAKRGELFWVSQLTLHLGELHSPQELQEEQALQTPQQDREFKARAPLHVTFGFWTHRGEVVPVQSSPQSSPQSAPNTPTRGEPSEGFYLTSDLELRRFKGGGELGFGAQLAVSPAYHPLHLSLALTATELTQPVAWASEGLGLALGLSYLSVADELSHAYGVGAHHELLTELTASLPLTPSLLVSLSALHLQGRLNPLEPQREVSAQLIVGRVTIGAL